MERVVGPNWERMRSTNTSVKPKVSSTCARCPRPYTRRKNTSSSAAPMTASSTGATTSASQKLLVATTTE